MLRSLQSNCGFQVERKRLRPALALGMRFGVLLLAALWSIPALGWCGDWPQWRGPFGNGSTEETNLPESCDPAKAKWAVTLPGPGHSTPIVSGERIFLTSIDRSGGGVFALCLDLENGKILWRKRLGEDAKAPQNNGATPSPATDGKTIWFLTGAGDLAALDFQGEVLWNKSLTRHYGNLATQFGYSSSPVLWRGSLFIQILRRDRPYRGEAGIDGPLDPLLLAFDPATGTEKWLHRRKSDAKDESREAYTTPVPFEAGGRPELVLVGADFISGHDPGNGAEHWRYEYNPERRENWRVVPSPVVAGGLVVVGLPRGQKLVAFRPGAEGEIDLEDAAWTYDERNSDSGTPLHYRGLLYILQSDRNDPWNRGSKSSPGIFLLVVDPATGKELGRCQIDKGGAWRTSPTGADGKIYIMSEKGEVVVTTAEKQPRILSRSAYKNGPACASVVAARGCILIRTAGKLTCIGGK